MTQKDLTFGEFTNLALRTESKIQSANMHPKSLVSMLELFIAVGTLLDYTKKGVFYNNYSKLDANWDALVGKLKQCVDELSQSGNGAKTAFTDYNFRVIHGLLGAITESSELAEHLLKYINTGEIDKAGIGEEFSDTDWYKAIIYDELQLDEVTTRTNVIDKLRVRYPDKYSDESAVNRNLEEERKKLEQNV